MKELEIEAKTVEEAIAIAIQKLGVKKEDVDIEIITEGKMGLFGLMGATPARVKVRLKEDIAKYIKSETINDNAQTMVKTVVTDILGFMGINSDVKTSVISGEIIADIKSAEEALLIGKKGQTLDALQFIVNLIINKKIYKQSLGAKVRVVLDIEGYRHKREEILKRLATQIADKVKSTGKIQQLEPMPPQERKIIHVAIGGDPELDVVSEGEGIYRKIIVKRKNTKARPPMAGK